MAGLQIDNSGMTAGRAAQLAALCPFGALLPEGNTLTVTAGCKLCRLCIKKSEGAITLAPAPVQQVDKERWRGVAVFADFSHQRLHPVSLELLGKARELAAVTGHPVYALVVGNQTAPAVETLLHHGADKVFFFDDPRFTHFVIEPYTNAFAQFIREVHPSSILVGATNLGRSLAPRVAARFGTGLTADCTVLDMEPSTDLVQIRPAFGGNIMARIVTPAHRPQFCTVRYKIFSPPAWLDQPTGVAVPMTLPEAEFSDSIQVLEAITRPAESDISDAEVLVAVGRGLRKQEELAMAQQLADALGGQLACTRPLVENGWLGVRQQIGLSGRTVKPRLLITMGISGAVQFTAGMRNADCIVAINNDPAAPIFDVAHYGLVGDLYEVLPALLEQIGGMAHVS